MTSIADQKEGRPQRRLLRRDAERNRQRIIEAAAEIFAERGLDVSLDDIARHAGLGVGTVYRRFPTKEDLIEALFEDALDRLATTVEAAQDAADPWEGLVAAITEVCARQAANRGLREVLVSTRYGQAVAERAHARLIPAMDQALERAREAGQLRPGVTRADMVLVEFMIGSVGQYTRHVPDAWRRYLQILVDGLRARPDLGDLSVPAPTPQQMREAMAGWRPLRRSG